MSLTLGAGTAITLLVWPIFSHLALGGQSGPKFRLLVFAFAPVALNFSKNAPHPG
jgi:hypothetical protein